MKLELTQDEALVLFEWLSRLDERGAFPCEDPAEEQVLWSLHGQLENVLTEPFRANYGSSLNKRDCASKRTRLLDTR